MFIYIIVIFGVLRVREMVGCLGGRLRLGGWEWDPTSSTLQVGRWNSPALHALSNVK